MKSTPTTSQPLLRVNSGYLVVAIILFITEVLIALYLDDQFIRPTFGDFLVVILIYCATRAVLNTPIVATAVGVLIFAYLIEMAQYYQLAVKLGFTSKLSRVVLGSSFSWTDMIAYTLGIVAVLVFELRKSRRIVH